MAPRIDIRDNAAEPGSTQINNVNLTTSMLDPCTSSIVNGMRLIDVHSVHHR
jgi:hypothetical protein